MFDRTTVYFAPWYTAGQGIGDASSHQAEHLGYFAIAYGRMGFSLEGGGFVGSAYPPVIRNAQPALQWTLLHELAHQAGASLADSQTQTEAGDPFQADVVVKQCFGQLF